jgi:hypothetical protein
MVEANTLYTILYTIGQTLLYSLILTAVLTVLYYPTYLLFKLFNKKLNWNFSALFSSLIAIFVLVIVVYFIPSFFGIPLTGYENADNKIVFILYLVGQFVLYSIIIALIVQLFVFLGSYLMNKFKFKIDFFNVIFGIFVVSLLLVIIGIIFPWIPGGILTMIWF